MAKALDTSLAHEVVEIVASALDDAGYQDRLEVIPGLVQAIIHYADEDTQLLDEAADLLADGGVDI